VEKGSECVSNYCNSWSFRAHFKSTLLKTGTMAPITAQQARTDHRMAVNRDYISQPRLGMMFHPFFCIHFVNLIF